MNARERLELMRDEFMIGVDNKQALRAIDELLRDMANEAMKDELIDCDFVRTWVERARALGYGDK